MKGILPPGIKCAAVTRQTDSVPVCFAACGNKGNEKMKRTIQYKIGIHEDGLTVKQFLKRKHYSGQNLVQLKKYEQGILINNMPAYVIHHLKEGDILTVNIWEEKVSEKSLLFLSLFILFMRMRILWFLIKRQICLSTLP